MEVWGNKDGLEALGGWRSGEMETGSRLWEARLEALGSLTELAGRACSRSRGRVGSRW